MDPPRGATADDGRRGRARTVGVRDLKVSRHDVAPVFRDYRNDADGAPLWAVARRGYEITGAGTRMPEMVLADDCKA